MIIVHGHAIAREGQLARAIELSLEHVARSRLEPGCISHAVHQDVENAQRLVFVEQWATQEALWAHISLPASRAFGKALAAVCSERPGIAIFDAAPVPLPKAPGA